MQDSMAELRSEIQLRDRAMADQQRQFEDYRIQAEQTYARRTQDLETAVGQIRALNGSNAQLTEMVTALSQRLDMMEEKSTENRGTGSNFEHMFGRFEQSISEMASGYPRDGNHRSARKTTPRVNMEFAVFDPEKDSYRVWLKRLQAKLNILAVEERDSLLWIENLLPPAMKSELWSLIELGATIKDINGHFTKIYGGRTIAQLMRDFESLKQETGERTITFYQRWRTTVTELKGMDIDLSPSYLVEYCMSKLTYEKEVRREAPRSTEEVFQIAIRLEEVYGVKSKSTVNVVSKPPVTCHYCGKKGHYKSECHKRKRDNKNRRHNHQRSNRSDWRNKDRRDERRSEWRSSDRNNRRQGRINKTVNSTVRGRGSTMKSLAPRRTMDWKCNYGI